MRDLFDTRSPSGLTWEQFQGFLAGTTHTKRVMELAEVANTAVFVASDKASGLTGAAVNLTMGATSD